MPDMIQTPLREYALDELVLAAMLRERATTHRGQPFLAFREGTLSFDDVHARSNRLAQGFAELGVSKGDHVALMLPNCPEFVDAIFALAKLGAVAVPINFEYTAPLLHHVLETSDATVFVTDEAYCDCFAEVRDRLPNIDGVVVRMNGTSPESLSPHTVTLRWLADHADEDPMVPVAFSDLQAIMYTSGTTGPSKGVMTPHALALTCAIDNRRFLNGWGKTYYCPLPLFHAGGLWDGMMSALVSGSAIGIVERFSASRFWDDVRMFDAAVAMGVFSMIPILLGRPASPDDKDHPLKTFYMGKSILDEPMVERFGVHAVETYTSTEAGIPTASPYGEWRLGSCGREHSERFKVAVVDEHDRLLPPGEPGEIVVRPRQPYVITTGYYGFWETTAHVFRNQWFHTGDRAWCDDDGHFYFLDRIKDAIRRRGENISAFELECQINLHNAVLECAAIGVPSEIEEEEVKVAVVLQPGAEIQPAELAVYCDERLPAFMVPRYIEFVDELPRTHTGKIAKHKLREMGNAGITELTLDREDVMDQRTGTPT